MKKDPMVCAITGHRPNGYPFGYDENHPDCIKLKVIMAEQIAKLIGCGVTTFLTGMALGADLWGAEIVLHFQEQNPNIRLIAVLPCATQSDKWNALQRKRYFAVLAQSSETVILSDQYTNNCMFLRNQWMVDHADMVLAVYNGSLKGGTACTVHYANKKHRTVIIIDPESHCASTEMSAKQP